METNDEKKKKNKAGDEWWCVEEEGWTFLLFSFLFFVGKEEVLSYLYRFTSNFLSLFFILVFEKKIAILHRNIWFLNQIVYSLFSIISNGKIAASPPRLFIYSFKWIQRSLVIHLPLYIQAIPRFDWRRVNILWKKPLTIDQSSPYAHPNHYNSLRMSKQVEKKTNWNNYSLHYFFYSFLPSIQNGFVIRTSCQTHESYERNYKISNG